MGCQSQGLCIYWIATREWLDPEQRLGRWGASVGGRMDQRTHEKAEGPTSSNSREGWEGRGRIERRD